MEKIMLGYIALFVLNVLLSPFLKKKGVLFCGLFGFSGDEKPNLAKLKILGMQNESRGRDSCGVYYNNTLTKGIATTKLFTDFLKSVTFDAAINPAQNVFIGHTRWSTVGAHTIANAHPFLLRENNIFAHNGTIDNIDDLLKKYGIDKAEYNIEVDSQGLGHLFIQNGRSILEEYRGYAAFLFHDRRDKDALWIFKGASRKWQNGTVLEERPLFYAHHREGIYFSSLSDALEIIKDGPEQEPIEVPTNTLIKVVGSTFSVEAYDIKREDNNIGIDAKKTTVVYPHQNYTPSSTPVTSRTATVPMRTGEINSRVGKVINIPFNEPKKVDLDISKETYPPRVYDAVFQKSEDDFVYFWKGRYYFGNDELCNGIMYLNKDGFVSDTEAPGYYENYFYRGVMIDGKKLYDSLMYEIEMETLTGMKLSTNSFNFAKHIAPYSKYPVTNMLTESVNVAPAEINQLNLWWMKDTRNRKHLVHTTANHSFTPMYSPDRSYVFRMGVLEKINCTKKDDRAFTVPGVIHNPHVNAFKPDNVIALPPSKNEVIEGVMFDAKVRTLAGFFRRKFMDIEEFNAEIPSTIIIALGYYIEDFVYITEGEASNERVLQVADNFIQTAITDKVTLEDNMVDMPGILTVNEYIKAAIAEENVTVDDKKKEATFNTKEFDEMIREEDEIKKNLRMGRTFTSLFAKKAKVMLEGKNPLGKKLAEEFQSCADLLHISMVETIDNQNQEEIITPKNELKNIIT